MDKTSRKAYEQSLESRKQLIESYTALEAIAKDKVDQYWVELKLRNRQVSKLKQQGEPHTHDGYPADYGHIAPRLRKPSGRYGQIIWCQFFKSRPSRETKHLHSKEHFSRVIKRPRDGFSKGTFRRVSATEWVVNLAMEYESVFEDMRFAMERYRKAIECLDYAIKRFEKNICDNEEN